MIILVNRDFITTRTVQSTQTSVTKHLTTRIGCTNNKVTYIGCAENAGPDISCIVIWSVIFMSDIFSLQFFFGPSVSGPTFSVNPLTTAKAAVRWALLVSHWHWRIAGRRWVPSDNLARRPRRVQTRRDYGQRTRHVWLSSRSHSFANAALLICN